jgi:hypothetical protein
MQQPDRLAVTIRALEEREVNMHRSRGRRGIHVHLYRIRGHLREVEQARRRLDEALVAQAELGPFDQRFSGSGPGPAEPRQHPLSGNGLSARSAESGR